MVLNQIVCNSRQSNFMILRSNFGKIGMSTTANKLYSVSAKVSYVALNCEFEHFKQAIITLWGMAEHRFSNV